MSDEIQQLTDEERAAILTAARRQKASRGRKPENTNQRQQVTNEEYIERLAAANRRDKAVLDNLRQQKIEKASKEWATLVGPTFAPAVTQIPQVLERVERMQTKQGLHKTSIIFHGNKFGRGKTWAAYSYLNMLVHLGIILPGQVFFGTESSTLARVANSGFERSEEMNSMKHASHKVFFIDDVGQAYFFKKEHREEVWYELIDHVYTRRLTLVITTNLEFNERGLGNWIGGRAFDRLRTLVGNDGAILLQGANRRDDVYRVNEEEYRSGRK